MVMFHVQHEKLFEHGFNPSATLVHGKLRAAPVCDIVSFDVSIEKMTIVPKLNGSTLANDILWRIECRGRFLNWKYSYKTLIKLVGSTFIIVEQFFQR